ncbi:hypothetical protein SUGI_0623720 [Cryptomeria japonica]|nr:hypothetical protein SUGI_0623720 [Cryptomeria japonica]
MRTFITKWRWALKDRRYSVVGGGNNACRLQELEQGDEWSLDKGEEWRAEDFRNVKEMADSEAHVDCGPKSHVIARAIAARRMETMELAEDEDSASKEAN